MLRNQALNKEHQPPIVWGMTGNKIYKNADNTTQYMRIDKSASATMVKVLIPQGLDHLVITNPGDINHADCGFTVVRNPIERFVSAYYTVNSLLYVDYVNNRIHPGCFESLRFWSITTEPQRFHAFIKQMTDEQEGYDFISCDPSSFDIISHVISQTQLLSVAQNELHFVLKAEELQSQFNSIARLCPNLEEVETFPHINQGGYGGYEGLPESSTLGYFEMMDMVGNEHDRPAWKGMDEKTWRILTQHYKQDFICFGYDPVYRNDVIQR